MSSAKREYRVVPYQDGWGVETDGRVADLAYVTE